MTRTQDPSAIADRICATSFDDWYHAKITRENIENGTPHYNDPAPIRSPDRHTPHTLLQCHRKITYRQLNAPEERRSPDGLFWTSRKVEHEVVLPYLRDTITDDDMFVTDSMYFDASVDTPDGPLTLTGKTDPVFIDRDGNPLLITEVKTTRTRTNLDQPNPHHRAQAHAYMYGLSAEGDHPVHHAIILYISRDTLELTAFYEPFDDAVWTHVRDWAITHTDRRKASVLPPATPEYPWECSTCAFKHRCGKTTQPYANTGPTGLLPLVDTYPRRHLREYLTTYTDDGAKLTPTLAQSHPDLAAEYGAYDWQCPECTLTYHWNAVSWTGDTDNPPICPECADQETLTTLRGPLPADQFEPTSLQSG